MIIRSFTPNESNAFFNVNLHFKMPHYALRRFAQKSHSFICLPIDFLSDTFDSKTATGAFYLSKGSGCFSKIGNQRFQWHFARNLSRTFDSKTATGAFCVSKS